MVSAEFQFQLILPEWSKTFAARASTATKSSQIQ